jgi:tripartite-type tricarboxylate transporter receptor subunit TctC
MDAQGGKRMNRRFVAVLASLLALTVPLPAVAQAYPAQPIRIVAGFPPGTGSDIVIRQIAQKLAEQNGWSVVVESKPGQGGSLAATDVAKAEPNGYTLLFSATAALATNPSLFKNLRYDPEKDFTPITRIIELPLVLLVGAGSPYKSLGDLVAEAKAKPGTLNYASVGNGSSAHLVMAMLAKRTGMQITHVPFKGSAEVMPALMSGNVHAIFESTVVAVTQGKTGKVRSLAVSTSRRISALPDVPTVAEAGVADFDMAAWFGMLAPAGLPQAIVQSLNQAFARAVHSPDLRDRLESLGTPVVTSTPAEFAAFIRSERAKWAQAVRESGATVD